MAVTPTSADAFVQTLEAALDKYADPVWLGEHSPLAQPFLIADAADARARGDVLRNRLRQAAAGLSQEHVALLNASFFERNPQHNINGVAMALNMSRAAYYRHRAAALQTLAESFGSVLDPALSLETAAAPPDLLDREQTLHHAVAQLRAGQSIGIGGPSGIGKTSLGQALARKFVDSGGAAFWFTVRPPLNDQLDGLVFALACFLNGLGAGQTWRQWVADAGVIKPEIVSGLLRFDLAQLSRPVLLCLDEIDLLDTSQPRHAAVLQLLDDLRATTSLLLIGQRPAPLPVEAIALNGLTLEASRALLTAFGVDGLSETGMAQMHRATGGNPMLLRLLATLQTSGDSVATLLRRLATSPSVDALLARVWQRLNDDERALWCAIAVCRTPAPVDAFDRAALTPLLARGLVTEDARGGVFALPPIRAFLADAAPADIWTAAHADAAGCFAMRGRVTPAAYHLIEAGLPERAVFLWFNGRERETRNGLSRSAQTMFASVNSDTLQSAEAQRALALLRAEWARLQGRADEGLAVLTARTWPVSHPLAGYAARLRGQLHELRGQLPAASAAFEEALRHSQRHDPREQVRAWTALGYAHYRVREMRHARASALQAQIEALDFRGWIETELGDFDTAERVLRDGLTLAAQMADDARKLTAGLHDRLGKVLWQTGRVDEAVTHITRAIETYAGLGDAITPLYLRMNLSAAFVARGDAERALAEIAHSLPLAQSMGHSYLIAGLTLNAAEARFQLGQHDAAEHLAMQSLQQEETPVRPYALTVLGMVQRARHKFDASRDMLQQAIQTALDIEDRFAETSALRELALTEHAAGDVEAERAARARIKPV
jgi:tetratricopeptide (TPR) repeat protein